MSTSFTLSPPTDYPLRPLPPLSVYEDDIATDICATAFDAHMGGSETLRWEDCTAQQFRCPGCPWARIGSAAQ